MMAMLVERGFTRREMLDERRPGRPYPGWSLREFIYFAGKVSKRAREQAADAMESVRMATTATAAATGSIKKGAAKSVLDRYQKAVDGLRKG